MALHLSPTVPSAYSVRISATAFIAFPSNDLSLLLQLLLLLLRSTMRVIEHLPVVGHVIAGCHLCAGKKADAERAAVNATLGLALFPVNMVAEIVDEATRERSSRIKQVAYGPLVFLQVQSDQKKGGCNCT